MEAIIERLCEAKKQLEWLASSASPRVRLKINGIWRFMERLDCIDECIDLARDILEFTSPPAVTKFKLECLLREILAAVESMGSIEDVRAHADASFPFLRYSVTNVLFHANRSQQEGIDQTGFLADYRLQRWIAVYNLFELHLIRRYTHSAPFLYILAERNLVSLIRVLPDRGSCVSVSNERYGPPLFATVAMGHAGAAEVMIELEANGQALGPGRGKYTFKGRRLFTQKERSFSYTHKKGVLVHAIEWGDEVLLEALLSLGVGDDLVSTEAAMPLCMAALWGNESAFKMLLHIGKLPIDGKDNRGRTPLSCAASRGNAGLCEFLLRTGKVDINSEDKKGRTPLSYAAEWADEPTCRLLLDSDGVYVDRSDNDGRTPISYAAEQRAEDIVKQFLDTGSVDINKGDNRKHTPLLYAARNRAEGVAHCLLDAGADINKRDSEGSSALMWAARSGDEGLVSRLLDTGLLDINGKDNSGFTPLMCAATCGRRRVVRLLLSRGADIDGRDQVGRTALSVAAESGRTHVISSLLDSGAVDDDRMEGGTARQSTTPRECGDCSLQRATVCMRPSLKFPGKPYLGPEDKVGDPCNTLMVQ